MKKNCYLLITLILAGWGVKSQPPAFSCTDPHYYCSLNMTDSFFLYNSGKIDSTIDVSYAKNPEDAAFVDVEYALDKSDNNVSCVEADDCIEDPDALIFKAYFPKWANNWEEGYPFYASCPLPMIIMVHGGGFSDCSTKEAEDIRFMCIELAKKGFVVFNLEYRRGKISSNQSIKTASQVLAVYRAIQDIRGAIRSICALYRDSEFDGQFTIDTTKLFLGGASAGSGAVLGVAYLQTQTMVNAVCPNVSSFLGTIDPDFYYASADDYDIPEIRGMFDMWGEFPMPGTVVDETSAEDFFDDNIYIIPVISFHGDDDPVTTPNSREINFPANNNSLRTTNLCLSGDFTLNHTSTSNAHDLTMIGTLSLCKLVRHFGKRAEGYIDCLMGHGIDNDCIGTGCGSYQTEFGTGLTTKRAVQVYMAARAAVFFQSILLSSSAIPGQNTFIECNNTRINLSLIHI